MKDEIKEILNRFDFVKKEPNKLSYYPEDLLTREEMWLLYDCITNLQEENERLSVELNKNMIERNNYLSRNEKANWWLKEMLKQAKSDETKAIINGTLELLLNGGDKE